MKKMLRSLMLVAAMLLPLASWAQASADHVVANGNATNEYLPYYGYWMDADQHNQMLYPDSMLTQLRGLSITKLVFYSANSATMSNGARLRIGITSASSLSNLLSTDSTTLVFDGTLTFNNNLLEFPFDVPFTYPLEGGNLIVDLQTDGLSYSASSFYGISTTTGMSIYHYNSNTQVQNFIPKTNFYVGSGCFAKPGSVTSVTDSNSAVLSWISNSDAVDYVIMISGQQYTTTDTTYTFTNLPANTPFSGEIYGICSNGDTSEARTFSFRTSCGRTVLPLVEDFDGYNGNFPSCWFLAETATSYGTTWPYVYSGISHSGNRAIYMYGYYGQVSIASPLIEQAINTIETKFWTRNSYSGYSLQLGIGYVTNLDSMENVVYVDTLTLTNDRWEEHTVSLGSLQATTPGYLVISQLNNGSYGGIVLDDITIRTISSCATPTDFVQTGTAAGQVSFSWNNATGSNWEIAYTATGSLIDTVTTIMTGITTDTATVTGLDDTTTYDFYVRSDCGNEYSYWVGPITARPNLYSMTAGMSDTVHMCGGTVTDDGGLLGDATETMVSTLVIYPSEEGQTVTLTGSVDMNGAYSFYTNYLYVYEGAGTTGRLIATITGAEDSIRLASTAGPITLRTQISYSSCPGFALQIACEEMSNCTEPYDISVSDIAGSSANVNWDYGTTSTPASFTITVTDTADNTVLSFVAADTARSYQVYGLSQTTTYHVSVVADCDGGEQSNAVSTYFTTTCLAGGEIEIGSGNSTLMTAPINVFYKYSLSQILYTADELVGVRDTIYGLKFYMTSNVSNDMRNIDIYIDTTSTSTLSTSASVPVTAGNLVASNRSINVSQGWVEFMFDSAFVRPNTTSNIVITLDDNTGSYSSSYYWRASASAGHTIGSYSDNTNYDPLNPSFANSYSDRPDVIFVTPCADVSCVAPSAVINSVTATSATLTWVAGNNETSWCVDYKLSSDTTWTTFLASTTSTSAVVTGLQPATSYTFRVGSLCDEEIPYSIATGYTGCAQITNLPFSQDFENFTAAMNDPATQACWNRGPVANLYYGTYYYPYIYGYAAHSGSNCLAMDGSVGAYIVLPEMGHPLDSLAVTFFQGNDGYSTFGVQVGYIIDPTDITTFVATDTLNYPGTGNTWAEFEIGLSCPNDVSRYICFKAIDDGAFIDDITVDIASSCAHPLAFTIDSVYTTSGSISWTDTASVGSYILKIGTTDQLSSVFDSVTVSVTHHTFTGLNLGTRYYVWIYTNCGTEVSRALQGRFTTLATAPIVLPLVENFENGNVFNLTSLRGSNEWVLGSAVSNGGNNSIYVSSNNGTSHDYDNGEYSVSLAYVPVVVPFDSVYAITFDWMCNGEAGYDRLRAALVPASYDLTTAPITYDGYGSYSNPSELPTGWIALDNGPLQSASTWQNFYNDLSLTAGNYNLVFVWANDASSGSNPPAAVDNVIFQVLTCMPITNIVATDADFNSVTIDWSCVGTPSEYEIEYGPIGFVHGQGTSMIVTTHPATITGLQSSSSYDVYVRGICSATDTGFWSAKAIVATECGTITAPYFESFEGVVGTTYSSAGNLANCWIGYSNGSDAAYVPHVTNTGSYCYPSDGSNVLTMTSGGSTYGSVSIVRLPQITQPVNTLTLSFHVATESQSSGTLYIGYMTGDDFDSNFVAVDTLPASSYTYNYYGGIYDTVSFENAPANAVALAFKWVYTSSFYSCGIDEVEVTSTIGACVAPTLTVGNVTYESATISWTGSADTYQIAIAEHGAAYPAETTVQGTTHTFSGLYPNTQYDVRIRQICDSATISGWAEISFTTDSLPCFAPTNLTASNATVNSITIGWTNNAQSNAQAWVVNVFNSTTNIIDTVNTNPATITGLFDNTQYSVAVQSLCTSIISSDWSDTITFSTTSCQGVSNVQVSNITNSGATVTWNAGASETAWEVNYGRRGFGEGQGTLATATTTTYQITGLEAEEDYDVYVRAKCAEGIYSDWSAVQQFTTQSGGQGIDGVEGNYSLNIYPNPAAGNTTISLRGIEGEVTITVVDMNGREISSDVLNCGADCVKSMNVEGLAQGTYFVRVLGNGINSVRKLIVR